jgi:hypothetical protein
MAGTAKCPVCGARIDSGLIPTAGNTPFACSRCRTQLEVAASDPLPILAVSAVLSVGFSFGLGLRGVALFLTMAVATAIFYWVGWFLRSFVAIPKLEKSQSAGKLLHAARRIHSSR